MYRSLSSNPPLLKPPLCTSVFHSSAMTLRRGSFFYFSAEIFTIGTVSGPIGFLRYDSIWDELQLLSCMTYRLSIPPPLRGVLSHITTAAVSYYRDWTPTSLIIIGQTLAMRMATGMSCIVSYSCFAYLSESWSDSHGCMDDENLGDRVLSFSLCRT